jgi:hypothetical protein
MEKIIIILKKKLFELCFVFPIFLAGCTNDINIAGGSGTETVIGKVVDYNGKPASKTVVSLIPTNYDPIRDNLLNSDHIDTTDENGNYCFVISDTGSFNVLAVNQINGKRLFIKNVIVSDDSVLVETDTLRTPATIVIDYPSQSVMEKKSVNNGPYIYIPGTLIACSISQEKNSVTLDSVPVGTIPAISYASSKVSQQNILRYEVEVPLSGDTVRVFLPGWLYEQKLVLNTEASGAGVNGTVTNFPLLIRLDSANFDFTKSAAGGSDIRFTKSNDSKLNYEIELWDALQKTAAIWVIVDSVYGNNNSQYIMMYWGNTAVMSESNGAAVYNSKNGYQAVWHLNQFTGAIAADATANKYNGTPSDVAPTAVTGIIGGAQSFNRQSNSFTVKNSAGSALNFPQNGNYSVSAWVYTDVVDTNLQTIVAKGDYQYNLEIIESKEWQFSECADLAGWNMTSAPAVSGQWVFVTGVRSGVNQYLYVNGTCVDTSIDVRDSDNKPRDTSADVTIGKTTLQWNNESYFFGGKIDELRIANVAQSRDGIKLCYMNQKAVDALVVFR